jgi:hypothetical protein
VAPGEVQPPDAPTLQCRLIAAPGRQQSEWTGFFACALSHCDATTTFWTQDINHLLNKGSIFADFSKKNDGQLF